MTPLEADMPEPTNPADNPAPSDNPASSDNPRNTSNHDNDHAKRSKVVSIRFTREEYKTLCERASSTNVSVSDYLRHSLDYEPLNYRTRVMLSE
jgi:hypothetical protein